MKSVVALGSLLLVLGACAPDPPHSFTMGDVEFSAPSGSAEPNLFAAADGRVFLTWFEPAGESGHVLRLAIRRAGRWSEPLTVARDRAFFVNWADFPSAVELADGTWVVHWLEKVATSTYAYHALLSVSRDHGRTWSEPVAAHADDSPTEHGFVSMAPLADGGAALVWLDGRNTGGERGGAMALGFNTLSARARLEGELLLDQRICDCCQTALVGTPGGLVAAYRDRSEAEIRDIAVVRHTDGTWTEPYHVGDDNWHYRACPVNGPALSAVGDTVTIAWYTAADERPRVQAVFSRDGGASFGAPVRVDDGSPLGRVDVEMLSGGSALVTWLEGAGEHGAEIRAREIAQDGERLPSWVVARTSAARRSGFPRMARAGSEIVFAWTETGEAGGVRAAAAVP